MKKDLSFVKKHQFFVAAMGPPPEGQFGGAFSFPFKGNILNCIASDGIDHDLPETWEHVSVHAFDPVFKKEKTPSWEQMCYIATLFWDDDEALIQFRPAKKDYVNHHEHVLHWWKPVSVTFPMPPRICV